MKKIDKYIKEIKEELHGAKEYAECYVYYKQSKPEWAKLYHDMALQELSHAQNFRDMGAKEYEEIGKVYISEDLKEKWEHCIKKYAEKMACIKTMLGV